MAKKLQKSEMFSSVFNRMIDLCESQNTTITALLDKFTNSRSAMNAWKNGNINIDLIPKIAKELNVSLDILLIGKEENKLIPDLNSDEQNLLNKFKTLSEKSKGKLLERAEMLLELETPKVLEPAITYIDLYDMPVSAGTGVDLSGYYKEELKVKRSSEAEQADFCLRISGDSMEPDYHDGDIILVKGRPTIQIGEIGVFVVNGSGYIKELGKNKLISLNDEYDDIILTENDSVWCMGEVIATLEDDDILD